MEQRTEYVHFYLTEDHKKGCSYTYQTPQGTTICHPTHITKEELQIIMHGTIERAMAIIDNHI